MNQIRSDGDDGCPEPSDREAEELLEDFAKHVVDGQDMQQSGSRGDNAGFAYPSEGDRVPSNRGLEMQDDEEEEVDVEEEEEDA